jgi:hypothetical protein
VRGRAFVSRLRARWVRTLLAGCAGLVLLLGAADLHGPAADHWTDRIAGARVSDQASHPFESRHFEASDTTFHPGCAACLLQLQTTGSAPDLPAGIAAPACEEVSLREPPTAPAFVALRSGSPRAPPFSPSFV